MAGTLKILGLVLLTAYAAGSPALADLRPRVLDAALTGFHGDVTLAASEGVGLARAAARVDPWEVAANVAVSGRLLDKTSRSLAALNAR